MSTTIGTLLLQGFAGSNQFISAALVVFLTIFLLQLIWLWRSRNTTSPELRLKGKRPLPPGSLGLPFVGETLAFLGCQRKNSSWQFIDERVAKHGEIFKTSLIGHPTVVIASPAGNKMIFSNENKLVNLSWPGSVVSVLGESSLIALKGEPARRTRHAIMTFLRPEAFQMYTLKAHKSVTGFIRDYWEGQEQVAVFPLMKRFTFSLACELLMSRYDREEQRLLEEPFTTMMKGIMQLPISLPGTRFSRAMAASKMLRGTFQKWIDEKREDLATGKCAADEDLLSCLLTHRDEEGKPLTDQEIKDNILLMLFAGHDTSTALTTMVCKFLAENPAVFDEVYKENREIAARKGCGEPLNWADILQMKLSWRVVQETLRLQPPVQGAFRMANQDFEFGGFTIPKAWRLYWTVNSTHRNARYFEEPERFDPSRFEGAGPAPYTFVPFGGGPRMCPGGEFARMEAMLLLHHLATRFSWSLANPREPISVDPMPQPSQGLLIRLHPRPPPPPSSSSPP